MSKPNKWKRFLAGFLSLLLLFVIVFSLLPGWVHTWGARPEELARTYPGDELSSTPVVNWTHGMTIRAPADQVWPWINQMGDTRAAYYSYTFIENLMPGPEVYRNADRILPEFQDTQPGQKLISDVVAVHSLQPGQWLLASNTPKLDPVSWIWMWNVTPETADTSRLVVRMMIDVPDEMNNPVVTGVMDLGGFVMEVGMMNGIRERAEGTIPPAWRQSAWVLLWLAVLVTGLVNGWRYLTRPAWRAPFATAMAAVVALLVMTFLQPATWIRVLLLALLVGATLAQRGLARAKRAIAAAAPQGA